MEGRWLTGHMMRHIEHLSRVREQGDTGEDSIEGTPWSEGVNGVESPWDVLMLVPGEYEHDPDRVSVPVHECGAFIIIH
tara:strand:+ start:630 stop:866 length:237 start_codon:yes stop_codon:yes gene_type:complete